MNEPIGNGRAFAEGANLTRTDRIGPTLHGATGTRPFFRPTADLTGRRRFGIDHRGAESRAGVGAGQLQSNASARDYAPRHEDRPAGWTVQTPWAAPPPVDTDHLSCVYCGVRDTPEQAHACVVLEMASQLGLI